MAYDFKAMYGMDYDQYKSLFDEAFTKDPDYMNVSSASLSAAGLGQTGTYGAMGSDPRSNIALYNAIKSGDKKLYDGEGNRNAAPEIDGLMVFGPMTEQMRSAKDGRWQYAGSIANPQAQGLMGSQWKDLGESPQATIERWQYVANPVEPVQQQQQPVQDDPKPQGPTIYDSWDDYINIAREETEGMNRMPFVGPNWQKGNPTYADVPYNSELALEMFYPGAQNEWRKDLRDPLKGEGFKPIVK